jgi:hypothetical protein
VQHIHPRHFHLSLYQKQQVSWPSLLYVRILCLAKFWGCGSGLTSIRIQRFSSIRIQIHKVIDSWTDADPDSQQNFRRQIFVTFLKYKLKVKNSCILCYFVFFFILLLLEPVLGSGCQLRIRNHWNHWIRIRTNNPGFRRCYCMLFMTFILKFVSTSVPVPVPYLLFT